ncbi:PTS glucose transporter subunit IIA [Enterococcus durans]|uniref:PTS sugar transporter subunit IIA n=1 Tax=Enterococcus sp. BSD2780061688st2 D3 TaxID=2559707 RepID=UPI001484DEAF|nr:PTS glucose transporter subunit IIA [Enterococcus sp. BSD2780061688st2 D3]MDB1678632.1 PTS glucose transporter subunit IIA [Enterococcus durans]
MKKKEKFSLVSPVSGDLINLDKVEDQVFSSKAMGDGFAVIPTEKTLYSPINGKVKMVFPTKHAICFQLNNGQDVIVHVGIDTVELNGEGFSVFVKEGDTVKQGQKIIELSEKIFNDSNINLVTMVVLLETSDMNLPRFDKFIKQGEGVIKNDTCY